MASQNLIQAVILAGSGGSRMFPIDHIPSSLFPIANVPILEYQLTMLRRNNFKHIMVVTTVEFRAPVEQFLSRHNFVDFLVEVVAVEESLGSADILRLVKNRLTSDVIVLSGDVIMDCCLTDVQDMHRIRRSHLTMVLKEEEILSANDPKKKGRPERDEEDIDLIGLLPDNRVAVKYPFILLDESFSLPKTVLGIGNKINIRTNLKDSHIYILSNFILHVIEQNPLLSSLKRDIVPLIIKNQFRRNRVWQGIKISPELREEEQMVQEMSCGSFNTVSESKNRLLNSVGCYAFVISASDHLCERINSISMYSWINREILILPKTPLRCFDSLVGFRKKEISVIGENCIIHDQVLNFHS